MFEKPATKPKVSELAYRKEGHCFVIRYDDEDEAVRHVLNMCMNPGLNLAMADIKPILKPLDNVRVDECL